MSMVTFAFQSIVDVEERIVFAYEALIRGSAGEGAGAVLNSVPADALHLFDRDARVAAISLAATLGLRSRLSLNFMPRALATVPDAIDSTIEAAHRAGLPLQNVILEVTEGEIIHDTSGFARQMNIYRAQGLRVAIDDFGAGYAGLNLLADFQPDLIKLDMQLVRSIDSKGPRQAIVRAVIQACDDLGIEVIAEGIETAPEFQWFKRVGVRLFQGYYFGRPALGALLQPLCWD